MTKAEIHQWIEEQRESICDCNIYLDNSEQVIGYSCALDDIEKFISHTEKTDVIFENEIDSYYDSPQWEGENVSWNTYYRIAHHFYEVGKKTNNDGKAMLHVAEISYKIGRRDEKLSIEKDLGWISVKDRLPEKDHFVLTCVDDYGHPQSVGMAMLLEDGTWWDGDIKVYVDYWMEVPQFSKQ